MEGLAPIDAWALAAIMAKAAGYGAALLAMGGPLFVAVFREAPDDVLRLARRIALIAALIGLAVLAIRFGIRGARLSGMGLAGAFDAFMLQIVWDSPLGTVALWHGAGAVLVAASVVLAERGLAVGVIGAGAIAASFPFIGHALGEPRWLLAALLGVHLLAASFWVGALAPLSRASRDASSAALLHRFGQIAAGVVAGLAFAGAGFAWVMTGSLTALLTTAYGWTLLGKLAIVLGLMALAARNKWRLVPALAAGETAAPGRLRRAIWLEGCAVALIAIATAVLTSVTTPPVNL